MARAKRTDRAEARRRHRAASVTVEGEGEAETGPATSATAPTKASGSTAYSSPGGRMPMSMAFRQSFHPVDIRADLAALPWLAVHTKALWIPLLVTIGGTVVLVASTAIAAQSAIMVGVLSIVLQYFIVPPAIGGVFIAGFLAPRASWLLGIIVGLVAAACYAVLLLAFPASVPGAETQDPAKLRDLALSGFLVSPAFGAVFASGAAWYRRFLQLSSPNRGRRADPKKKTGTDGKSRTAGRDQKAGARR